MMNDGSWINTIKKEVEVRTPEINSDTQRDLQAGLRSVWNSSHFEFISLFV